MATVRSAYSPNNGTVSRPAASSARDADNSPREGKFGLDFSAFRTSKGNRLGTRNRRDPSRKSSRSRRAESVFSSFRNHFATTLASTTARAITGLSHLADEGRAIPPGRGLPRQFLHEPQRFHPVLSRFPFEHLEDSLPEDLAPVDRLQAVHPSLGLGIDPQRDQGHGKKI